jgi:site-specific DNA recombinase
VDLENIVKGELKLFFGQRERVAEHLKNADRNLVEKSAALEAHQHEIQKVQDEMTRTHRLYLDGGITSQGFGQFYKPAEERLNQLRAELPKLEAEVDLLKVNKLSADDVIHESATLHERWPSMAPDDRRKVIEALIEKITIGNGEIDITYSCLPTSEELCKNQQGLGLG